MYSDGPLIHGVSPAEELVLLLQALQAQQNFNALADYWPYPKQASFHKLGATVRERLLSGGNQTGKTKCGASEVAMHVTGRYPSWWKGYRFTVPNHGMAGSETSKLTGRGIVRLLLGRDYKDPASLGTGAIPRDCIIKITPGSVAGMPESVTVKFESEAGIVGTSTIKFASYDQGRKRWQADTLDWVWFDEEPPLDIYSEGITRTNITMGPIIVTFTPLLGMSQVVKRFFLDKLPNTSYTTLSVYDAEHYSAEQIEKMIVACPPYLVKARIHGVPGGGEGLIFPVDWAVITCQPFEIPPHFKRINGLDFGWDHPTAVSFLAYDQEQDIVYVTRDYRQSLTLVPQHASVIKNAGPWIPVAWPADGLQEKGTGVQLAKQYRSEGVNMLQSPAQFQSIDTSVETANSLVGVEPGLQRQLERMRGGRMKVFSTCTDWFQEAGMYRRKIDQDTGKVVIHKMDDDLMDSTRYGEMMLRFACTKPVDETRQRPPPDWRA